MKTKLEKAILDSMINNPNNWHGIFYKNPNDPRVVVRKNSLTRNWSFNWASPYSYISLICIWIIIIASIIFL
jgi:uncharacterized membrane protein